MILRNAECNDEESDSDLPKVVKDYIIYASNREYYNEMGY